MLFLRNSLVRFRYLSAYASSIHALICKQIGPSGIGEGGNTRICLRGWSLVGPWRYPQTSNLIQVRRTLLHGCKEKLLC